MKLDGKVAIITGAGQGIGKAIALALARKGSSVVIADINIKAAEIVKEEVALFSKAIAMKVDVSKKSDVDRLLRVCLKEFGKIDVLVNNAGIAIMSGAHEITEEQWDEVIEINLKGTFLCCQAVGKEMIKVRNGKIVNIASISGHSAAPNMMTYNVSKAGVIQLTKTLAVEWAKYNINVNSISPGITESVLLDKLRIEDPKAFKAREQRIPLKRVNKPGDIAKLVVFLSSEASNNITGEDIRVDGGMLAIHPGLV
jgi:NAD(P)-dependent dehydrogenase (short-subunit alcohol dehydrogenase family)